ncbi:superoxide dismutase family protein [Aquimarina sp. BL5]|uniref:superoxide dismutase family protein n=1 Tax=Aquimarina sp. BL5 TaxID=1714860 RepID=UPI000E519BE3|nr:superoxide dismutase family protein [Aquimarina sp. BL5]AXT50628.1 superoxide dismutase family protein [Aquimarina sp. BL5]RKN01864.1 superoxide dismutase family protein [Aquimarina sp. BL5]
MKTLNLLVIAFLSIIILGCKGDKKEGKEYENKVNEEITEEKEETSKSKTLAMSLTPKSDSEVSGNVTFTEEGGMVTMVAYLSGLSEGEHAIHIHEKADCSSADGKSTGGHWNPTMEPHGKWGASEGYHKGDIGNFNSSADGKGSITFATNEWCIGCGDEKKDIVGKAIIVHQGIDDYKSQPSGAAGSRVSCGGIIE